MPRELCQTYGHVLSVQEHQTAVRFDLERLSNEGERPLLAQNVHCSPNLPDWLLLGLTELRGDLPSDSV